MLNDEQAKSIKSITESMVTALAPAKRSAPGVDAKKAKKPREAKQSDTMSLFG